MRSRNPRWMLPALLLALLSACGRHDDPKTAGIPTDQTSQPTTPPPAGDSTPKAADPQTATAAPATEDASRTSQSTVGSAASGAPPYTLGSAPEGNKAPKDGDPPKK